MLESQTGAASHSPAHGPINCCTIRGYNAVSIITLDISGTPSTYTHIGFTVDNRPSHTKVLSSESFEDGSAGRAKLIKLIP
jgi:hypothetical protein